MTENNNSNNNKIDNIKNNKKSIEFKKIINATYDEDTITVYQAYNKEIAKGAVENQKFVEPWSFERTTWIKPSLRWMMYRSGYGLKDKNQERILSIKIKRDAFEWMLENHFENKRGATKEDNKELRSKFPDITVQFDPERSIKIGKFQNGVRSIQIGIKKQLSRKYNDEWIVEIKDITDLVTQIKYELDNDNIEKAISLLPVEKLYTPKNVKFN